MASSLQLVETICEQANLPGQLTWKRMFGEFGLYLDGIFFAIVADNLLYVKPTDAGRKLLGTPNEQPPYPGASLYFQIDDEIDDRTRLQALFRATAAALPRPKVKPARTASTGVAKKK